MGVLDVGCLFPVVLEEPPPQLQISPCEVWEPVSRTEEPGGGRGGQGSLWKGAPK